MCLAFGYRLMCYAQRDLNVGKRHRMAAELAADGFGAPPFDYKLFDLPTSVEAHRTDYFYMRDPMEPEDLFPEDGLEYSEDEEKDDVQGLPSKRRYPSTRILFSILATKDPEVAPEPPAEEHWPSQFSTKYHRKAGFIYSVPKNISEMHTVSKTAISRACRLYGVKNYEVWSREPLEMFRRWFLNEVAGKLSLLRGGLAPMGH